MCFLAVFNAFSMRGCLSIAITEMVKRPMASGSNDYSDSDICFYDDDVDIVAQNSTPTNVGFEKVVYDWDERTQVRTSIKIIFK